MRTWVSHLSLSFEWCNTHANTIHMNRHWVSRHRIVRSLASHSQVVMLTEIQWHLNPSIQLTDQLKFTSFHWHQNKRPVSSAWKIDWSPLYHMKSCTLITLVTLVTSASEQSTPWQMSVSDIFLSSGWKKKKSLIIMHWYLFLAGCSFLLDSSLFPVVSVHLCLSYSVVLSFIECECNNTRERCICCEGVANRFFLVLLHAFVLISEFICLELTVVIRASAFVQPLTCGRGSEAWKSTPLDWREKEDSTLDERLEKSVRWKEETKKHQSNKQENYFLISMTRMTGRMMSMGPALIALSGERDTKVDWNM